MRHTSVGLALLLLSQCAFGLFRGNEYEPRDWPFNSQYALDVLTFQLPRSLVRRYREAESGFYSTAGSINARDLLMSTDFKLRANGLPPSDIIFLYTADQDFDGTYTRFNMDIEFPLKADWYWRFTSEVLAHKEYCDIGAAFRMDREPWKLDLVFVIPNPFWNNKNDLGSTVERWPANFRFSGEIPVGKGLLLPWYDLDKPCRYRYDIDAFNFTFQKYRFGLDYELPLSDDSIFWIGTWVEYADKQRWGYAPGDPLDYTLDRDAGWVQMEYERPLGDRQALTAGLAYLYFKEDQPFPNDPLSSVYALQNDYCGYVAWTGKLSEHFWFRTGLYLDRLDWERLYPGNPASDVTIRDWYVKVPFMFIFPSEKAELIVNFCWQAVPNMFGGGNIMLFVEF